MRHLICRRKNHRGEPHPSSIRLRPVSFRYMLLLAQTPGELVMREIIYRCLWPGEINYEGTRAQSVFELSVEC